MDYLQEQEHRSSPYSLPQSTLAFRFQSIAKVTILCADLVAERAPSRAEEE